MFDNEIFYAMIEAETAEAGTGRKFFLILFLSRKRMLTDKYEKRRA